ncbi:tetratricopeptide repeat protein [Streptomyces sp. NPDC002092]
MELDRRVQIRVRRRDTDKRGFGSGYLIAPRLVLTAAHVLDGMDGAGQDTLTVTQPDTGENEFPATVRWRPADGTVDAVLIEVSEGRGWRTPESLSDLLTRPPQRFGLVIGTRPVPVTMTGFPRMQKDVEAGLRLDEQLMGAIFPGSGSLAGRYEISSTDPTFPAASSTGSGSRWSGVSGAALLGDDGLGGDMLCGVVGQDRQADSGSRLIAVPAARLLTDEGFRAALTEHTGWEPAVEPVEAAGLLTPAAFERDLNSPAALLRADAEAVAFHGRDSELAELRSWCEGGPPAVAVRVLTGPGGQGKTRLARRLTDVLSQQGWVTGHLRSDLTDYDAPPDLAPLTTSLPLLVVVDYAETRPRLLRRLITHLHRSRHRVRLLLLARSDGEWRTDALNAAPAVRSLLAAAPITVLAPLISRSRPTLDRCTAFTNAALDLARLLPRVPTVPAYDWTALASRLQPPDELSHPRYDNALTLQLTVLVTLLQHGPKPAGASPGTPAEEILLQHEGRFWEDSAEAPAFKLNLPTATLAAAVAVAALCGATAKDGAAQVIGTVPDLPTDKTARTAAWLASLYPAEPDRYWGSLQPDRIAEYHASSALTHGSILLPGLLAAADSGQQTQLITVLARAAIAHYNAGRPADSQHVLLALDTALDTALLPYSTVRAVSAALPYTSRITAPLALRLTSALAGADQQLAAEDPAAHEPSLASSLSTLGILLSEAGRRGEALTAAQHAVEIRRRLTAENPAAHESDLARSLSNLGLQLAEAGRRSEALATAQEAVEIYRRLTAENPATHEPDLARSLSNLGLQLAEAGRRSEALATAQQAVEIYRRLTAENPATHAPDLAHSLGNLGARLAETGRRGEALATAQEAVEIYRRLTAENPATHEPDLAGSLSNLGIHLSEAGRHSEALTAEQQAVEIRRRLTAENPAAHESDLARSLSNLGLQLAEAGRRSEALATAQEAVEIYRRLTAENPATHAPSLAHALAGLCIRLAETGRNGEALTTTQETVEIRRRLTAENPATHAPDLATSLSVLTLLLGLRGDLSEALIASGEAVELYRNHLGATPAVLPQLHTVLGLQADLLSGLGREGHAEEIRRWLRENPLAPDSDNVIHPSGQSCPNTPASCPNHCRNR